MKAFTIGLFFAFMAIFASPALATTYTISTSASPPAGGTTGGDGTFNAGATVSVTATPNSGYGFANWTLGGSQVSTLASYTFNVNASQALVANFVPVNVFTYTISNGKITITGYTGTSSAVSIPSAINTGTSILPVVSIGANAFASKLTLTSVTIPDTITSLGDEAFYNCQNLPSVTIPSSVTSLSRPFLSCSKLTSITVNPANSVYSSSSDGILFNKLQTTLVFYPSGKTGSYAIPNSVTTIGTYAFYGCTGLTGVTIPSSVTSILRDAFSACNFLTSVFIPSSVTNIAISVFARCTKLAAITVDPANPFYSTGVDGVLFNKTQTAIIEYPAGKTGSYTIPSSVISIGDNAFYDGPFLSSVTIPSSVSTIGVSAFYFCTGLTSATFQGNAPSTGLRLFASVHSGFTVYYSNGATGFTSPTWTDSAGDSYPAVNLATLPGVTTLAVTSVTDTGSMFNGTVNASGFSTDVSFSYGLTNAYGTNVTGTPTPVTGSTSTAVSALISGLSPGTTYHFRVNGVNANGTSNGGDLTFTTAFATPSTWRQQWYGTTANTGNAADSADPYHTGVPNLAVFALLGPNQDPAKVAAGMLLQPQRLGANYVLTFNQPSGVSSVTYGAEWCADLTVGNWTPMADTGSGTTHTFSVPLGTGGLLFVRLRVTEQ